MWGTTSAGLIGNSMAATNSACLVPKKCITSEGSTPASPAMARTVAARKPSELNRPRAASRIASRVPESPGRRPRRADPLVSVTRPTLPFFHSR